VSGESEPGRWKEVREREEMAGRGERAGMGDGKWREEAQNSPEDG
jgi:hypothetical protein